MTVVLVIMYMPLMTRCLFIMNMRQQFSWLGVIYSLHCLSSEALKSAMSKAFVGDWVGLQYDDATTPQHVYEQEGLYPRQLELVPTRLDSQRRRLRRGTVYSWRLVAALILRASGMPISDILDVLKQYVAPLLYYWGGPAMYLDFKFGDKLIEQWQYQWLADVLKPYVANGFIILCVDLPIPHVAGGFNTTSRTSVMVNAPFIHEPAVLMPLVVLNSCGYSADSQLYESTCHHLW
jgi:hypothetical protein